MLDEECVVFVDRIVDEWYSDDLNNQIAEAEIEGFDDVPLDGSTLIGDNDEV